MPKRNRPQPPTLTRLEVLHATLAGHPIPMTAAQRAAIPVMIAKVKALLIQSAIESARVDYAETRNPLHLLNGFVTARRAGLPVPDWILEPMTAAMEAVLKSKGTITLDEAIGLTPKKGQRSKWTEQTQHETDARIKYLIEVQLKQGLLLKSDKDGEPNAVRTVAAILKRDPENDAALLQTYHKRLKKLSSRLSR